ncbi:MAG: hypothetical protein IKY64_05660 [Bacteroidaceae bacterium]|nr:hypothetical protein [Bacteroidaceae bacterium]
MDTLDRLISYLVLRSATTHALSLYHGKMGIVLTLMIYAQHYSRPHLYNYAERLLLNVCDNIPENMAPGLEEGLAGIGFGITILHKNGLVDGSLDDILADIDTQLMRYDPRRYSDFSFRTGLCGIKYYIDTRRKYYGKSGTIDPVYERELTLALERNKEKCEQYTHMMDDIIAPMWPIEEYKEKELGIDNGCAYYIIKEIYDEVLSD